jgi:hypothetical protein
MTGETTGSGASDESLQRQRAQEEFFLEHLSALDLVVGWQRGGIHLRGCYQTTYLLAAHSEACEKIQPYLHLLSAEQVAALPVSGSEYASNSASEY